MLAAGTLGKSLGLSLPTTREILEATESGRAQAYEARGKILDSLAELSRPPGRPRSEPELRSDTGRGLAAHSLRGDVLGYLMTHPGCVCRGSERGERGDYSVEFRQFVLELRRRYDTLDLRSFAEAAGLPFGTVEDWQRPGRASSISPKSSTDEQPAADATIPKVEMLLDAWRSWQGKALAPFAEHVREHLCLDFSNRVIAQLLFERGARQPKRRRGRLPDEEATRGRFETFFPGAQWVGDGTEFEVVLDGITYRPNLELMVDAYSAAWVGLEVSDEEDSGVVVDAFQSGIDTTGDAPIAVLLDNKACNHTEPVNNACRTQATLRIRATLQRPQNKAHCEGAFGLFAQTAPPVELTTTDPDQLAKQVARLIAVTFARAINQRPRPDRGGRSRAELYADRERVTDEQRAEARRQLAARLRKQERARLTRAARQDPIRRQLVDRHFLELGLEDPERHFRDHIVCYSLDSIVDGIGIFKGKRAAGTLVEGKDSPEYLLGIVRNLEHQHESLKITSELLRVRLEARDALLAPLCSRRESVRSAGENEPMLLVDEAMKTERTLERLFWLQELAELIRDQHESHRTRLFRRVAQRIHTYFKTPQKDRSAAEQILIRCIWPLD